MTEAIPISPPASSPGCIRRFRLVTVVVCFGLMIASGASAQEELCDNSYQDCRDKIRLLIQNETDRIDVSFWFMDDWRYKDWLIAAKNRGVKVRVILDVRGDTNYPANKPVRDALIAAGIPIRYKTTTGINHWKMMLYGGQQKVHFSAANFSNGSYSPVNPYEDYVDEAIYFTSDAETVHTFMMKYDDIWTDTTHYANLANVSVLERAYPTGYVKDPELNFPPDQDYQDRLIAQMRLETQQIDVAMFRITSGKVPDEMLKRRQANVPIRLITDREQYRNTTYFWHSYNLDRMYMAGIPIKWKNKAVTDQDMHQKSVVLYGRDMAVFGSSNWTSSSSDIQREHNYFTLKTWFIDWFKAQFERKWNNTKVDSTPLPIDVYVDYVPAYPETPVNNSPANQALGVGTSVTLKWEGGWWAHKYDIYFGTTNPPPLVAQNYMPGSATAGVQSNKESYNPCSPPTGFTSACPAGLEPGVTYYWRVRGKTMIGDGGGPFNAPARAITGPTWSFTTAGGAPAPADAPGGLQATSPSSTRVDLSWNDIAGEQGYKIERKLASASSTAWAQIGTTNAGVTTFANASGLTPSTAYQYRVRAWTTGGNSPYSNVVTVTTLAASPAAGRITADAYVRAGQYAGTKYGTGTELISKFSADLQYHRQTFLKLDISAVQPTTTSVTLRLSGKLSDTRAASVRADIYPVSDTSWSETGITWSNKPALGSSPEASVTVSGTTAQWYSVNLTTFVKQQRDLGRTVITIGLICPVDTLPYVSFASRESSAKPELVITP